MNLIENSELPSVKFGKERDRKIVQLISESGPYSREQIQRLVFPSHKWPQKCRQRLNILVSRKQIKRIRFSDEDDYVYYCGTWNQKSEHALMLNWAYTALVSQRKSWWKIQTFHREYVMKWGDQKLIADALLVLKNVAKDTLMPVFIEADKDTSKAFDKVPKYTAHYLSQSWFDLWWAKPTSEGIYQYPKILTFSTRPGAVRKTVEKENIKGLRFNITDIESIKQDIYRHL